MKSNRWYRWTVIAAVVAVIAVALHTCGIGSRLVEQAPVEEIEAALTLRTVTLEQPDENGKLLWRLKAESVTYSPDNQKATLKGLNGEFFQAGETIYTVVADEGEVRQNGETLFLRGNLVATSKADELVLEGELLKWQPKEDRLMMGNFPDSGFSDERKASGTRGRPEDDSLAESSGGSSGAGSTSAQTAAKLTVADLMAAESSESFARPPIRGYNPQIEAIAQVVTVANKDNRVELTGGVAAKSKENPWMTFESENLTWFTQQERIETNDPLKVEQYKDKTYQTVSDRITGKTGQVNLTDNIVTLNQGVAFDSLTQPLKVQSETAVWDVEAQTVALDKPVNIEQPEQKVTVSANQARLDLAKEVVYLTDNVRANGEKNDARLVADTVTWQTESQNIEATGNVSYQQATNPEISMTGTQAVGNLGQGTFVVTGNESGPSGEGDVVIEFVPGEDL
ncbi:MAG: Lipopolysaccharide-assembly, LptC-related protein [Phormidesmis priestleyi Ana]|uniref:Lipopolysaccharide-assembly, LptC-related protein n=1 Tax=Phormidesmis priestleyi Ana TaxID=1666911 RepID=A0A0P8DDI4_9CYAN|nr:MAG: Lipopolysaccharide-assembly, LptC-related protein [Phormidesmis priestleyi Ana]